MQNRSMGVGRAGGGRGGNIFHLLSSDRTRTHLDPSYLEELEGKSPGQAKNHFGACKKNEDKADSWRKGQGEGGWAWADLQLAEPWPSSENRQVLCQLDSGSRNQSWAAESLCRAFQKHFIHLWLPQSNPSWSRGQDRREPCCENKVLAECPMGGRVKFSVLSP